jgi:hypothetical protein
MCVVTSIKSVNHRYELLLDGHQMSESEEIVKSVMFYVRGTCPHLFFLKEYPCS